MLRDFFGNITPICKNLLFLNIAVFIFIVTGGQNEYGLFKHNDLLGMHYPASPEFRPFQIVSYLFAHGNVPHLIFNMFALVSFGSLLERMWGPRRFLLFYFITGLGALVLHEGVNAIQIYNLTGELAPHFPDETLTQAGFRPWMMDAKAIEVVGQAYFGPIVGASGAIYGLLIAFAMLFPNTELMLIFFPVPVKAKYFVPFLLVVELFLGQANFQADNIAHYAHLGGALFGFILVKIWQRNRSNFY